MPNDTTIGIDRINALKMQPLYLRRVADDMEECGRYATAHDYRESAGMIEQLLTMVNIPAYTE